MTAKDRQVLEAKMERLAESVRKDRVDGKAKPGLSKVPLKSEPYTEEGAQREISLTEKELNALIANQPDMTRRVAIDLSGDLVSVKIIAPMDTEIPVLGGKTLRFNLGVNLGYEKGRPMVALKGVSLGEIPLPNA